MGETIAVIPARGGSKGISGKNIKAIAGKPLIAWSIEAAGAPGVDRIVVSTDDDAIAQVAEQWGAQVVRRPAALATDHATTEEALEHAVLTLEETPGILIEEIILLQPTSPVRPAGLVEACRRRRRDTGADSLLTVCPDHLFYWRRAGDEARPLHDYRRRPRRQEAADQDRLFRENGSVYITTREILMTTHNRLGGRIALYEMAPEESFEIDSPFDFWLVDRIMTEWRSR